MIHDHGAVSELLGTVLGPRLVASRTADGAVELHRCSRTESRIVTTPPATEDDDPVVYRVTDPTTVQATITLTPAEGAALAVFLHGNGASVSIVPAEE